METTIDQYRRELLKKWISEVGNRTKAAELTKKYKISYSYLGQLVADPGNKGSRNIGKATAAKLEKAFGKPELSMTPQTHSVEISESINLSESSDAQVIRGSASNQGVLQTISNLKGKATPRSREVLAKLERLAVQGKLTDKEWDTLDEIASRFEEKS